MSGQPNAETQAAMREAREMAARRNKELSPMDMDVEAELDALGKTAPRITPSDVLDHVMEEWYFTAAQGVEGAARYSGDGMIKLVPLDSPLHLLTFCVLVLRNGFTVTGESACADPATFDADIGQRLAREAALRKVWPLLGYELRTKLSGPLVQGADS